MSKRQLIANIESSWNAWIAALDGIPRELTNEPGVCGDYSVKDLVGHIAFWDEQDLLRAQKLARGEVVPPNDWQTMNDQEYAQHKDNTLEAQSARMNDAHATLEREVRAFEDPESLRLSETWPHYDEHRNDVLVWRRSKDIPRMNDEILTRIETSWQELLPVFDGLSEAQAAQPGVCGYYSIKDLTAHLAAWEDHTRRSVESSSDDSIDVEAKNDLIFAANRDRSFEDLKAWLIEGHSLAISTFALTPNLTEQDVEDDTWEHYREHGDQIRAWRISNGV